MCRAQVGGRAGPRVRSVRVVCTGPKPVRSGWRRPAGVIGWIPGRLCGHRRHRHRGAATCRRRTHRNRTGRPLPAGCRSGPAAPDPVRSRWSRRGGARWGSGVQRGREAAPGGGSARTGRPAEPTGRSPAAQPRVTISSTVRGRRGGCRGHRWAPCTSRTGPVPRRSSDNLVTASSATPQDRHRPRYTDIPWSGVPRLIRSAESPACQVCTGDQWTADTDPPQRR